jgi:hypothetical protein
MSFKITLIKFNNTKEHITYNTKEVKDIHVNMAKTNWRSKKIAVIKVNGTEVWRCPKNHKK